jgi:hypothetical protein
VLSTISTASPAALTGPGCIPVTYRLSAPQSGPLDGSVFAGGSEEGITVFFPTTSSGTGFTFQGRRVTEPLAAPDQLTPAVANILVLPTTTANNASPVAENTSVPPVGPTGQSISSPIPESIIPTSTSSIPTPDYNEALAEIGVLESGRSGLFGASLNIEISIYNFGTQPFTLSESNVTLTQPDGAALTLKSSDPGFPAAILPGETRTIALSFEMPSSPAAVLRILTAEFDIEEY